MTLVYCADSTASPSAAWRLLSRPAEWHRWAPHLRGAIGMGAPEVRDRALGVALLGGVVPVPGAVIDKQAGRSWSWRVGLMRVDHRVRPRDGGARIVIEISAPWPLERLLAVSYGPVVARLVHRLAALAERDGS